MLVSVVKTYIIYLLVQQSADTAQLLPVDEWSALQLSNPQVRLPAQSESRSQSPPPRLHGLALVQQLQSVEGFPSQDPGGDTVGGAEVTPPIV